jgi:hypothetical protein
MATLSAKEAARELGTDARTFRKFMRIILPKDEQPGQGNRYNIEKKDLRGLRKQFDEWQKPKTKLNPNGAKKKGADVEELTDEELEEMMVSDDELLEDVDFDLTALDDEEIDEADDVILELEEEDS